MSAMEKQNATEDSQNKEHINDSRGSIVLKTKLAFFLGSRDKQFIINSYYGEIFLQCNESFICSFKEGALGFLDLTVFLIGFSVFGPKRFGFSVLTKTLLGFSVFPF